MKPTEIKELEALIKMLRKHGVREYKGSGMELQMEPLLERAKSESGTEKIDTEPELSTEELMTWSANGY